MSFPVLDRCPGTNLYIGGFIALRRPQALRNCHITHVVSVLDWQFSPDDPLIRGFKHLLIPLDDVEDENILSWFPRSNDFIHNALNNTPPPTERATTTDPDERDRGNGVLIHCAMGKSRSATILLAYLLWSSRQVKPATTSTTDPDMVSLRPHPLSVMEALTILREGRGIAEPNEGFMKQLHMYVEMGCPTSLQEIESHRLYRRWMNKRNVEESLRINRAPEMADIIFEDEADVDSPSSTTVSAHQRPIASDSTIQAPDGTSRHPRNNSLSSPSVPTAPSNPDTQVKCRKCRRMLAKSSFIIPHLPPKHRDPSHDLSNLKISSEERPSTIPIPDPNCAHIFLHPLSWMKQTLADGQLDGRLVCPNPKCGANVGKFAWQGLRCNCGGWVTPAFAVAKGRVDITGRVRIGVGAAPGAEDRRSVDAGGGDGIRLPPGMKRGGGGNL